MSRVENLHERASTNKRGSKNLTFPEDILVDGNGNIIRFKINLPSGSKYLGSEYQPQYDTNGNVSSSDFRSATNTSNISRRFSSNYTRTTTKIDLYMPDNVNTKYGAEWGSKELGFTGEVIDAAFGAFSIAKSGEFDREGFYSLVMQEGIRKLGDITASVASLIPGIDAKSAKSLIRSTVKNPYREVLYEGASNRTFDFNFKMIARNAREQQNIKNIINEFKFHQAPEFRAGDFHLSNIWIFPSEFDIELLHNGEQNNWLFRISTCALTNVSVDYSPDGSFVNHEDGSPFVVGLSLSFQEMETLTKERIKENY